MIAYIIRSFIRALLTMLAAVTIVFILLRISPIDPASFILGDYATPALIESIRQELGIDLPLHIQYFDFLKGMFTGDLGLSYISGQPVITQLLDVLPYTIELLVASIILGVLIGIPLGIIAALKPNKIIDHLIRVTTIIGVSIPTFVLGIILIYIFSIQLDLLPIFEMVGTADVGRRLLLLILPAFSCAIWMSAGIARLTRASMLDVMTKEYIATARSKGLRENVVILKHAVKNTLIPVITYLGITINILLGSAVITEIVFTRTGVGRLIVEGIISGDFQLVQAIIMLYAGAVVIVNLIVDITNSIVDPRIRKS